MLRDPAASVANGGHRYTSNPIEIHVTLRNNWDPIHKRSKARGSEGSSEDSFNTFRARYGNCIKQTTLQLPRLEGWHLKQQVDGMKCSACSLDGILVEEMKCLPIEFWNLRADIENLGEATGQWPQAQYNAYQVFPPQNTSGKVIDTRPLRIFSVLNRIYFGARCHALDMNGSQWIHPDVHGAVKKRHVQLPYICSSLDVCEAQLEGSDIACCTLDSFKHFDTYEHGVILLLMLYVGFDEQFVRKMHNMWLNQVVYDKLAKTYGDC